MIRLAIIGTDTITQLHAIAAQSLAGWRQPHAEGTVGSSHFNDSEGNARFLPTRFSRRERRSLEAQLAHPLDGIEDGIQPVPGGSHGYVNMQIIDAAYESNRLGQAVFLEEQQ